MRRIVTGGCMILAYVLLLRVPQPRFPFSLRSGNLTLYSDQPIPDSAGKYVLLLAEKKLARSPLYSSQENRNIFLCVI